MLQPQYEEYLMKNRIFHAIPVPLEANHPKLGMEANHLKLGMKETSPFSLESSLKLKNLFEYWETWDASVALELDRTAELSAGVEIPRIGAIPTPLMARISFLSGDWWKSSLKEHLMGVSVGLLSTMNHNLAYNLTWRTLKDPARMSSNSIQEQLGHSLLPSIKYAYKVDKRDSTIRPTCGYAFLSSSQVGALAPGSKYPWYLRQEVDLQVALPLGVLNGALNAGVAAGIIHPFLRGSTGSVLPLSERFYLGGHRSFVCRLGGPSSLSGFKARDLEPRDFRTCDPNNSENGASTCTELDGGGDIAVTAFADLSFDLPLKSVLDQELGVHGHAFVSAANIAKLTEHGPRKFPLTDFLQTFRCSVGFGVLVPTELFRIEMNCCYILKQFGHDWGKTGIQFNCSPP
ncbi:hypothetical protein SETIT_7G332200v2 [Setaria italica]|uniref:Bacterial surface antigen (D15) domain-containing protein n=1 Tax=Setaria italica TaxID=4555 RepID=A0A368S2I3_SETIT|nr:uncharacterized protein LOC101772909 isoform X2 [Setaria italica]RCV36618.1 hypothetical protein SETIT_7G332200v2 [Setaria italica]RCV36619.1 hypothetical protein SETIT_7G332200v2 [Setaria italica]